MYTEMFVEYTDHIHNTKNSEILSWEAFCNLCCEPFMEVTFCCATTDPRVSVE